MTDTTLSPKIPKSPRSTSQLLDISTSRHLAFHNFLPHYPLSQQQILIFVPVKVKQLLLIALISPLAGFGQIGGDNTFEFLNLPLSARMASMGGTTISVMDDDINLSLINPALLDSADHNLLGFNFIDYFTDVKMGSTAYARTFKNIGTFSGGISYIDYGSFQEADETGQLLGSFSAAEYSIQAGYGRQFDSMFSGGANLKFIYSRMYDYYSSGLAADLAFNYNRKHKNFSASVLVKNMGVQLKSYNGNREDLPFEIQAGFSKKPKHMPFRFSVTFTHLEKWDLTYEDPDNPKPTVDPLTGEEIKESKLKVTGDKLMRHVLLGGEFLLTKNFNVRFGYNYMRRKDLIVDSRKGMVGFSWGLGFKISKFHLSYGRAKYHMAGSTNHFSITTNLSSFLSRR